MSEKDQPSHGMGDSEFTRLFDEGTTHDEFEYIFTLLHGLSEEGGEMLQYRKDPTADDITYVEYLRRDEPIDNSSDQRHIAVIWPSYRHASPTAVVATRIVPYDEFSNRYLPPHPMDFYAVPMPIIENPVDTKKADDIIQVVEVILDILDETGGWAKYHLDVSEAKYLLTQYRGNPTITEPSNDNPTDLSHTEIVTYENPKSDPMTGKNPHLN